MISVSPKASLRAVAGSDWFQKTMLMEWFVANRKYASARTLTYCDFPIRWFWMAGTKTWVPRTRDNRIGRIYYVHPSSGELYYFRMLLMIVAGATCFADVRIYNGVVYRTFKVACAAEGSLGMTWNGIMLLMRL